MFSYPFPNFAGFLLNDVKKIHRRNFVGRFVRRSKFGHEKIRNFSIPLATQACLFSSDDHKEHAKSEKGSYSL